MSFRQIGQGREVPTSILTDKRLLLLTTGELIHWRDGGGIILALTPAYSPFTAVYFKVPRWSCEFSRESEVETVKCQDPYF